MDDKCWGSRTEEWVVLHRDYEKYEQFALVIKLVTVVVCLVCLVSSIHLVLSTLLILTLWFMEGVWKTFQARMGERILTIEKALVDSNELKQPPFQFYSEWELNRPRKFGLVKEYF